MDSSGLLRANSETLVAPFPYTLARVELYVQFLSASLEFPLLLSVSSPFQPKNN